MFIKSLIVGIIMQASFGIGPFLLPLGIKDKPFKGEFEQITSNKLPNGEVTRRTARLITYQAADGSRRFDQYGKDKEKDKTLVISIYNSAKQEIYFLDVESKTVFTQPLTEPDSESEPPIYDGDNLGKKVIENLICRGYQRKRDENDVFEYWVSEELNETLRAKSVLGDEENSLRLFNIERVEPDGKMFLIPKDYKPMKAE